MPPSNLLDDTLLFCRSRSRETSDDQPKSHDFSYEEATEVSRLRLRGSEEKRPCPTALSKAWSAACAANRMALSRSISAPTISGRSRWGMTTQRLARN